MKTLQSELPSSFQRPAAEDLATCRHCQADIVRDALDQWCDAGTDTAGKVAGSLVFCHDQDENPDYQRHEPTR